MGRGKKTAWQALNVYPDVVDAFAALGRTPPTKQAFEEHMPIIERFVIIMYDRTNSCNRVDDARRELFTQKGRSIEMIPPTYAALYQHAKRAAYQAGHCWGQALLQCMCSRAPRSISVGLG